MKRFWLACSFCLIFSMVYAQTVEEALQQGLAYARQGNYKKALKAYNKALNINPASAEAYYHRGEIHYELREYEAVIADNKEAIRLKPDYQNAYFHLGIAHYRLGEFAQTIQYLTTLLALQPQDSEAFYWRGMAYKELKNLKEACADWQTAQKLGNGMATPMLHKHCEEENAVETGH